IRHVFSLLYLAFRSDSPKILDAVNAMNSSRCALQALHVVHIALHDFHSALRKFLRSSPARISGQRTNSPTIPQQIFQESAALFSSCAAYQNGLVRLAHDLFLQCNHQSGSALLTRYLGKMLSRMVITNFHEDRVLEDKKGAKSAQLVRS